MANATGYAKRVETMAEGQSTLDFLLRRVRHATDLPAFAKHIIEINEKTSPSSANYASATELANTILKDYSLTNKLLRLVNSAYYARRAGKITTVTRAVVILGFEQVRLAASSILLFEHLQGKSSDQALKEEVVNALMSGVIGRELGVLLDGVDVEEAFICSMFSNLGKILVIFHLPEEYERIESFKMKKGAGDTLASRAILGISYEDLGRGIAEVWKFPEKITLSIQERPKGKLSPIKSEEDARAKLSWLSNELCEKFREADPGRLDDEIEHLLIKYRPCFSFSKKQLSKGLNEAVRKFRQLSEALDLSYTGIPLIERVSEYLASEDNEIEENSEIEIAPQFDLVAHANQGEPSTLLIAGIEDVSSILLGKYALRDVLTVILETMYRGFGFNRVVLSLLNKPKNKMVARLGFGRDIQDVLKNFRFSINGSKDVFNLAVGVGKDIGIDDTRSPNIAKCIPQWYKEGISAPAFVLFPVSIQGKTVGLFYADKGKTGRVIEDAHLDYMKTLRNQAALALLNRTSDLT